MYVASMYSNASVRFLVSRKAWANFSKRSADSCSVGGGLSCGWHGAGVTTALAWCTLLGITSSKGVGAARAPRGATRRKNEMEVMSRILAFDSASS